VGKKMKRSKALAGGRGKRPAWRKALRTGQPSEKILTKKRAEIPDEVRRVLDAPAPDIAGLDNPALYVEQFCFVISWFRKMFERVGSHNKELAREARAALTALWRDGLSELTALALDKERKAEEWAGRLLATTGYWIASDDEKLRKANEAYRQEQSELRKSKFWRPDLWFPTSKAAPLYKAIHRELWCISFYRGELVLPKAQFHVQGLPEVKRLVPMEYQPFMKLPPLSPKTWRKWEPKLWALVREKNPELLEKLQANADRKQIGYASSPDAKRKWQIESHTPTIKEFRPQFRKHLSAIAKRLG
jgi:hypothetical protein